MGGKKARYYYIVESRRKGEPTGRSHRSAATTREGTLLELG